MLTIKEYLQSGHIANNNMSSLNDVENIIKKYIIPVSIGTRCKSSETYKHTDWEKLGADNSSYVKSFYVKKDDWDKLHKPIFKAAEDIADAYDYRTWGEKVYKYEKYLEISKEYTRIILISFKVDRMAEKYYISIILNKKYLDDEINN